ncbi:CPBP family intramembrane glutamic endopeptidase [Cellulosimicrobium cellulans]|uniref:CPBP family intramembrane glutamic endopeptidase n=1 Tax=Cellulosimicrobium cellulans TaxID=1710 RepID=UPI000848735D|nr:CPBP family intramembrane glutamic endopeptidase [Cellulosimicrobium cellulans]
MTTTPPASLPAAAPRTTTRGAPPPRGGLAVFWALAFGLSWGPWAAALAVGGDVDDPLTFALYALGGCGPSLAALVLAATGRRSPRLARWGAVGRWLPAAVGLGAVAAVVTALVAPLLGGPEADVAGDAARAVAESGGLLAFALLSLLAGPLSEEIGWRGYAQPRLRRLLDPLPASALLGAVWSVWHLPLFLLDGTWQSTLGPVETALFLAAMVPMSSAYWFVTERLHGGVPAAVLLHLVGNAALTLLAITAPVGMAVYVGVVVLTAAVIHLVTRPDAR